jgi:hypothetical protein
MIGCMVWWESAAAPDRGAQPSKVRRDPENRNHLKHHELLGLFGFRADVFCAPASHRAILGPGHRSSRHSKADRSKPSTETK